MKQRITYFRPPDGKFEPTSLQVEKDSVQIQSLDAAKEHRLTLGLSELPQQLSRVLEQLHEFHLRWVSPNPFVTPAPLSSRASPGLHVFVSPEENIIADLLCPTLQSIFSRDLKCDGLEDSFSTPTILSTRFTSSPSLQYYANVASLDQAILYIQHHICQSTDIVCQETASSLLAAQYLDIDYDAISRALIVTVFWDKEQRGQGWTETIQAGGTSGRVEVGVLNDEKANEPEELSLGGLLTVVGEDTKPSQTLFSFPSRYHPSQLNDGTTFQVSFRNPTGLHPTMLLELQHASKLKAPWPEKSCSLHAYVTLPSYLFIDKYQFSDKLFLDAHNLVALRSISGATDLEAPDYVVTTWGSAALFELKQPPNDESSKRTDFEISIPMHLRYLTPVTGGYRNVSVPWPVVFWACRAEDGTKMPVNPFDRRQLGYDSLFGERTAFSHLSPYGSAKGASNVDQNLNEIIRVPVLDTNKSSFIQSGTGAVVVLGFAWVLWRLFTHGKPMAKPPPGRQPNTKGKSKIR